MERKDNIYKIKERKFVLYVSVQAILICHLILCYTGIVTEILEMVKSITDQVKQINNKIKNNLDTLQEFLNGI